LAFVSGNCTRQPFAGQRAPHGIDKSYCRKRHQRSVDFGRN